MFPRSAGPHGRHPSRESCAPVRTLGKTRHPPPLLTCRKDPYRSHPARRPGRYSADRGSTWHWNATTCWARTTRRSRGWRLQHRVWRPRALDAWRRAGITVGDTVLDVGSGPGHAALDLAEIVGPSGRVLAIDRSRRFLDWLEAARAARGLAHLTTHEVDLDEERLPQVSCRRRLVALGVRVRAASARPARPGGGGTRARRRAGHARVHRLRRLAHEPAEPRVRGVRLGGDRELARLGRRARHRARPAALARGAGVRPPEPYHAHRHDLAVQLRVAVAARLHRRWRAPRWSTSAA